MIFTADFLLLLVLACVAAPHSLDLGQNARISTLQPFLIAAVVLFGTREAMLQAAICLTYFYIVSRPRLPLGKALFNVANFVLAAGIAGAAFTASGGRHGDVHTGASLAALLVAVLGFFFVNTGLVATAIGWEKRLNPMRVWYEKYSWTLTGQLAGASLVVLIVLLRASVGLGALFVLLPFAVLIYQFFRIYFRSAARNAHQT